MNIMNAFDITVSLTEGLKNFTVIPADNTENTYSTYFQLLYNDQPFNEIRLNEDLAWEVCKGREMSEQDLKTIVRQIESVLYYKPIETGSPMASAKDLSENTSSVSWIEKIFKTLSSKKSAA